MQAHFHGALRRSELQIFGQWQPGFDAGRISSPCHGSEGKLSARSFPLGMLQGQEVLLFCNCTVSVGDLVEFGARLRAASPFLNRQTLGCRPGSDDRTVRLWRMDAGGQSFSRRISSERRVENSCNTRRHVDARAAVRYFFALRHQRPCEPSPRTKISPEAWLVT